MTLTSLTSCARRVLVGLALAQLGLTATVRAAEQPRSPITVASEEALWWGDFAALEKQNAHVRQPNRFDTAGTSQLELFRKGLDRVFDNDVENVEQYVNEMDHLTLQWAKENPKSALAHALHANALLTHGWSYRGGGYARDVPPEAWKQFESHLRRAAEYLSANADVALTDSYSHLVLLKVGRGLGWNIDQMVAIAADGLKRNPDDLELHFAVMKTLLPKWGGNAKVLDSYIQHAAEQTRARYGEAVYAQMYSLAAKEEYGHALFEDSLANWSKLKQGYDEMAARYPENPVRLNRYAYLACLAKDRDTFLKSLKKLGTNVDAKQWGPNPERSLEGCRRWAKESGSQDAQGERKPGAGVRSQPERTT